MNCDVGEATELWRRWSDGKVGEWAELIDIEIYSRAHSPTPPLLYLSHSSFSNPSFASPTSQASCPCISPTLITTFSQNIVADTDKNKALIDCHKCTYSFFSIVKSHPLKIPPGFLEKVRTGSCLKLFLIDCRSFLWIKNHRVKSQSFHK